MKELNSRTKIKFCGLRSESEVRDALSCGIDALGFVFYKDSPRNITTAQASKLSKLIPVFVSKVALVVNASDEEIEDIVHSLKPGSLQFHGDENPDRCKEISEKFGITWMKALRVSPEMNILNEFNRYKEAGASAVVLDAYHPEKYGGSGLCIDWDLLPTIDSPPPIVLAGGLTADNVAQAIRSVRPHAVDLSSGIEVGGVKDLTKMKNFIRAVKECDNPSSNEIDSDLMVKISAMDSELLCNIFTILDDNKSNLEALLSNLENSLKTTNKKLRKRDLNKSQSRQSLSINKGEIYEHSY